MRMYRAFFAALAFAFLIAAHPARAQEDVAPVTAAEASHAEHAEEGGSSMPQLDSTYYPSQLFWLAVSGILLYVLMARVALPRVSNVVEQRDEQVRHDLEQAYKLKQKAEDLKIGYTRALRDADEKSKTMLEKTVRDLKETQAQSMADAVTRINAKIAETEQNLGTQKDALIKEVPMIAERLAKTVTQELAKGNA